jgi:hypothetical protein
LDRIKRMKMSEKEKRMPGSITVQVEREWEKYQL